MSSQPGAEEFRVVVRRRRRTRRHRRNRVVRRGLLVILCGLLTFVASSVVLQRLTPSLFRASRPVRLIPASTQANRELPLQNQAADLPPLEARPVYPYSIVPGGVRDAHELKWAAQHDPVVATLYAGFDYDRARVVRLTLARTAYLSYRIGNKVYWTAHRVSLKKGETVITDGKITARTRCANRVEEVPQQATSRSEPPATRFEEPIQPTTGTAVVSPPVPFESTLLNRNPVPGLGPAPPLSLYDPLNNGNGIPIAPPPLPQVCGIGIKKRGSGGTSGGLSGIDPGHTKKKPTIDPCETGGGGTEVPEPGTWMLVVSGLGGVYWKARQKFARK